MASVKSKAQGKSKAPGKSKAQPGSRKSARELAKAQAVAAQRKGRLTQILVISAVALVVIGIIGSAVIISIVTQNSRRPVVDTTVPLAGGTEVPFAVDGSAIRLGPADAKVTIDLYVDYSCPHCKSYDLATAETYEQLVGEGNVAVKYHLIQFQEASYSLAAGSASAAVAVNQPQDWLAFSSAMFVNQTEQTSTWNNADFQPFAQQQGVTNETALQEIGEGKYASWVKSNTQDAVQNGVDRTPTVIMNGERQDLLTDQELIDKVHELAGS